ncbi:MAG TPA: PilZ domain-containing protein [Burkholderiaceae bacterium]|jgi:c-di-GMP-binding flagellar brake protein YcgR
MTEMTDQERVYPRKPFRCRATISIENNPPVELWTVDISLGGISLMLDKQINSGQYGVVKFDALINGISHPFSAIVKTVYGVRNSAGEYRTGFQFFELSAANAAIINGLSG